MVMAQSDASKAPSYRGLLALVIILGVLIVLGVVGLIVAAVLRAGNRPQAVVAATAPQTVLTTLAAPGKSIQSTQLEGNRILVRLAGTNGEELVVLDANTGRVIVRVAIDPRP
jgi:hypothetical protein